MLYPKSAAPRLDKALFAAPTNEYRGVPFWSWNARLEKGALTRQLENFARMGFGGANLHPRTGLDTPYLSAEFMEMVRHSIAEGARRGMASFLYDEDRYASGAAGGFVTRELAYRSRYLLFTPTPYGAKGEAYVEAVDPNSKVRRCENGRLLACYDVTLGEGGVLERYRPISPEEPAQGVKWYAYLETAPESPWFNNQTYLDALNPKAVQAFLQITHEAYYRAVGGSFGGDAPAIFTDEPNFSTRKPLPAATLRRDCFLAWTDDLPETFQAATGLALLDFVPELVWELPGGAVSPVRYRYFDHLAQRFTEAFPGQVGAWCQQHHLMLTGHLLGEHSLAAQTDALGELMRPLARFQLPGIDNLCDAREYVVPKQCQSVVHQLGREGMLSELYGVNNWDFDLRRHKLSGDWQAALGVTVRVPHLAMYSMAGNAKRDYPASISYQAPWAEEYPLIENHFARVNTAMTRGRPVVRVAVVHPIESYWLHCGPQEETAAARQQLEERFQTLCQWLLFGLIDFDYLSESLLPALCPAGGAPLQVGKMAYDVVVVAGCETLRSTTLERLAAFAAKGGQLLFAGEPPRYLDALPSPAPAALAQTAVHIPFERSALLPLLEPVREVEICHGDGRRSSDLLCQLRQDGESRWLFVAHGRQLQNHDILPEEYIEITLPGRWKPTLYDTVTGEIRPLPGRLAGEKTVVPYRFFPHDSLLLQLEPGVPAQGRVEPLAPVFGLGHHPCMPEGPRTPLFGRVPVRLSEPNALLLDLCAYALDGEPYRPVEEVLRADNLLRTELGLPTRQHQVVQPWCCPEEPAQHTLSLRFTFQSELALAGASLALEGAAQATVTLNGQPVAPVVTGYYVDEAIGTLALPPLRQGENMLELTLPFGPRTNTEWCYLLGDFGVRVEGALKTVTPPVRTLCFGDICSQGLPFYGGNLTYELPVTVGQNGLTVRTPHYRGALVGVSVDGRRVGTIAFAPYRCHLDLPAGEHTLGLTLFGTRVNTFGPVHNANESWYWFGANSWFTRGDEYSYEYRLKPAGILKSPEIVV